MKIFRTIILFSWCLFILTGCTKSNLTMEDLRPDSSGITNEITNEFEGESSYERKELLEETEESESMFDWLQVDEDVNYIFDDKEYYPLGVELIYEGNEEAKEIKLAWILQNNVTEQEVLEYACEMIQKFNNILAIQTTDVELATTSSFGGIWNTFSLSINIATENGTIMLEKTYNAGESIDLKLPEHSSGGPLSDTDASISPSKK